MQEFTPNRRDLLASRLFGSGATGKTTPSNDIHIGSMRLVPTEMHRSCSQSLACICALIPLRACLAIASPAGWRAGSATKASVSQGSAGITVDDR